METDKSITTVDYDQKWIVTIAVGICVFLATLDGSIVNVSLPTMVASLKTNFTVIQWVVLGYLLTVTSFMLGFGRLGDIFGKKRIYLAGVAIFTAGSALCGMSPNVYILIGSRVLQGAGAAMVMALGNAIITEAFPPRERGKAMGIIGAIVSIGIVTGPALGGVIVDYLSWHWIFFVNVPVGIAGIAMVWRCIPNFVPSRKQRFDFPGALLLFASLISLLVGLSLGQQYGFADSVVLTLLGGALALCVVFIAVEARVRYPMVSLNLFANRLFCVNLVTGLLSFVAMGGIFILIPFYLSVVLGYPTAKVGLLMCVVPIMMGILAPVSGVLSDRVGPRPITVLGLVILFFGYLAAATLTAQTDELGFVIRILGIGLGMGVFLSPNNSAIMGAGDKGQLGVVSGLMALSRTLGQTVGVSVIGTLWAIRIRTLTGNWQLTDVTRAPVAAQVQGLQFIFIVVAIMIFVGLVISVYGYMLDRKMKRQRLATVMAPAAG